MTARFAVFGFLTKWQMEGVLSLAEKCGGEIVYWNLKHPHDVTACSRRFPNCRFVELADDLKNKEGELSPSLLDVAREARELAVELWPSFYKSSSKFGIEDGGLDAHTEFYSRISTAISILDKTRPDILLYGNVPSGFVGYACYLLARKRGVKIRILRRILLPGIDDLSILMDSIDDDSSIRRDYSAALNGGLHLKSLQLPENIATQVDRLRAARNAEESSPAYFKSKVSWNKQDHRLKGLGNYFLALPAAVRNTVWPEKKRRTLGGYDTLTTLQQRHRLYRRYHALASTASCDAPYIYVPLHYQPEASTVPTGGLFGHQHFMVDLLSRLAPEGWKILIKEHPSQLLFYYPNKFFRSSRYYEQLAEYPNVQLLPITGATSFDLIRNANAVATVTGYSGWEAINWGIPALVFGSAWYSACDGVHRVRDDQTLRNALKKIAAGEKPDARKIDLYLKLLCEKAIVGKYRSGSEQDESLQAAQAEQLATSIQQSMSSRKLEVT